MIDPGAYAYCHICDEWYRVINPHPHLELPHEASDFAKLYVSDCFRAYRIEYGETAIIYAEDDLGREWEIEIIEHPDRKGDIAIRGFEDNYEEADGEGLYRTLWQQSLNHMSALAQEIGLKWTVNAGWVAEFYNADGPNEWLPLKEWKQRRIESAEALAIYKHP